MATGAAEIIRLNVRGVLYSTTKATLTRYPSSMIGAMFSGPMSTSVDDNGCIFVDRNGKMFRYVLDFLRSDQLSLPSDFKDLDLLATEADFYQVEPLIAAIQQLRCPDKQQGSFIEVIQVRIRSDMQTNSNSTIISGSRGTISGLPSYFFEDKKLQTNVSEADFVELVLQGSNVRLRLGEYLQNNGWTLNASDMSSSSAYENTNPMFPMRPGCIVTERIFRDRWFKPEAQE